MGMHNDGAPKYVEGTVSHRWVYVNGRVCDCAGCTLAKAYALDVKLYHSLVHGHDAKHRLTVYKYWLWLAIALLDLVVIVAGVWHGW